MASTEKHRGDYNSRNADKFVLRLVEGLRDRISSAADANHRSMNSEILARLDGSLDLERKYTEMRLLNTFLLKQVEDLKAAQEQPTH